MSDKNYGFWGGCLGGIVGTLAMTLIAANKNGFSVSSYAEATPFAVIGLCSGMLLGGIVGKLLFKRK